MTPQQRRSTLAKIHIARKDLGLDEDTYRDVLAELTGKRSGKDMTDNELGKVLNHFKKKGFKPKAPTQRSIDASPEGRKVRALWLFLYELGQVRDPSETALASYVRRITKVDAMQWTDNKAMLSLIETLKQWAMRVLPQRVDILWKILDSTGLRSILVAREAYGNTHTITGDRAGYDKFKAAYDEITTAIKKEGLRLDPSIAPRIQADTTLGSPQKKAIQSGR